MRGVNVWEHLKPNSRQGMTWHSIQDRKDRIYNRGQRLDHFVVSDDFTDGTNKWQIDDIKVFQGVGSSDHCPLLLLLRKRNGEIEARNRLARERDIIVRTLESGLKGAETVLVDLDTGRERRFDSFRCPVITMTIEDEEEKVFIDSGAPFSIYNPPIKNPQNDRIAERMRLSSSKVNCMFKGVGGGRIEAAGNAYLTIKINQAKVEGRFVFLKRHEPTLPRFLLGMDIITGDLEGVRIKRDTVRFEIDPSVVFESALQIEAEDTGQEETVSLLDIGEEQGHHWRNHFSNIAEHEEFKWATPDPNTNREDMQKSIYKIEEQAIEDAFEDAPLPMLTTVLRI